MKTKIAVASTDGKVVNQHFGKAEVFYIIEADTEHREPLRLKEIRQVTAFCEGGDHKDDRLDEAIERIADCEYVLVSRIGYRAANAVEAKGIKVFELPGIISESLEQMLNYIEIQNMIRDLSGRKAGGDRTCLTKSQ
ncbi:MAG: dinitrogenase iron-molybdenum cofactor biosynthesis protein [Lachnospiraceae bacterium]|nr:dinitrogenase iron-molybdenum cofactor biosynthesis protein [Lachnospiraceae bacterium]